ncbi:hypothetical protein TWF481_001947 [Arthrobotrys musiformis]|uniref:Uncharacterized protein n=1 Tax=Arthrobotrys musiformis TaxID=47236 RepID=A0AAV9VWC6_9PEZI
MRDNVSQKDSAKAEDQPLSLKLNRTTILVDGQLQISFRRTVKVPDNQQTSNLPPDLGPFKLTNVNYGSDRLPASIKAKGGLLLPMYEREAMWIKFRSLTSKSYAIKVLSGGVNAISGEPEQETIETKKRRKAFLTKRKPIQDYLVVPGQPWLDGFATAPGKVHQFVATTLGKGKTIESQITGVEDIGGLQFHITPQTFNEEPQNLVHVPHNIPIRFS